jgi:hypothetical protein
MGLGYEYMIPKADSDKAAKRQWAWCLYRNSYDIIEDATLLQRNKLKK